MKMRQQDRLLLGAVALSTGVLIILGGLQVHWSRQVSEAARERIGTTLKAAMLDWHLDLLRQISSPAIAVSTAIDAKEPVQHYLEEYDEWTEGAQHPDLVSDILVLQHAGNEKSKLQRLDLKSGLVEPAEWPAEMEHLHNLLASSSNLSLRQQRMPPPPPGGRRIDPPNEWLFDPHIPALVYAAGCGATDDRQRGPNCVIISFNREVLEKALLPELAERYFGSSGKLEYQVAVVGNLGGSRTVYTSDKDFDQDDFGTADARMNVFGPNGQPPRKPEPGNFRPEATMTSMQRGSWRDFPAPVWFNVIRYSPDEPDWYLMVRPRRGSLEDIVSGTQKRDLGIGFGVLFLLAVSTFMVVVTSRRAQRLARMQMQFISSVSHELRTPLAVICSAADNLADGVVRGEQQVSQYRAMITGQARQLTALMEQVLNFAATGAATPQYHLRSLEVAEIIATTLERTSGLIQEAEFQIEQKTEAELPPVVGDLDALSQCLQNLIVNAVKYSTESRWIGVRAVLAEAGGRREVQISVADHGMGISGSDLERIFEPFYRSPDVVSTQVHGTGLGLSLASNIARAMNGKLTVESTPGKGSVFTLHLPANRVRRDESEDVAASISRS